MIAVVGDEEIAETIQSNVVRAVDLSEGRGLAVSAIAAFAGACDRSDDTRYAVDAANPVMVGVGDIQVPGASKAIPDGWFNSAETARMLSLASPPTFVNWPVPATVAITPLLSPCEPCGCMCRQI